MTRQLQKKSVPLPSDIWRRLRSATRTAYSAVLNFTFPPHCLACDVRTGGEGSALCRTCAELMDPIDPSERCPSCFSEVYGEATNCQRCQSQASLWDGKAAVFSYRDTAATIIRQLKYGDKPHLAQGAAAYMAVQAHRLQWPVPDLIVPVPMPWPRRLERGYNQSQLLAEALAPLWGGSVCDGMIRDAGEWSQAGLAGDQRSELTAERFRIKDRTVFAGQGVCLVDDVTTTGYTLDACGEVLLDCGVSSLYALTLCQAER